MVYFFPQVYSIVLYHLSKIYFPFSEFGTLVEKQIVISGLSILFQWYFCLI